MPIDLLVIGDILVAPQNLAAAGWIESWRRDYAGFK
jgi:hypothetical protein